MSLTIKEEGFKQVPAGTYPARCIKIIDLGTQHGEYEGKEIVKKQVMITWELPTELIPDGDLKGKPYGVSMFFTASLSEKAKLRQILESWRGRAFTQEELAGFDLRNILGKPCMASVVHTEKGRAKISAITSVPKGMTVPTAINELIFFDISNFNQDHFDKLSEKIQKMIQSSDEYMEGIACETQGTDYGDNSLSSEDIPF